MNSVIVGAKTIPLVIPSRDVDVNSRKPGGKFHIVSGDPQGFSILGLAASPSLYGGSAFQPDGSLLLPVNGYAILPAPTPQLGIGDYQITMRFQTPRLNNAILFSNWQQGQDSGNVALYDYSGDIHYGMGTLSINTDFDSGLRYTDTTVDHTIVWRYKGSNLQISMDGGAPVSITAAKGANSIARSIGIGCYFSFSNGIIIQNASGLLVKDFILEAI